MVVLGGGFGGAYAAQALERRFRGRDVALTLVDRHNYFVFYPLLVEAGTGNLEPRHTVVGIRQFLRRARFRMAEVTGVDTSRRAVECRADAHTDEILYDHLVLALGSVTRLPDVPGLDRYGFDMKSLGDAVRLRDRAIRMLELADQTPDEKRRRALLHVVVVGANFTGAEVAGEFDEFLASASRIYRNVQASDRRITLVERDTRILNVLDPDLSEFAKRKLESRGVHVRLGTSVREIGEDTVHLDDGTTLDACTTIWCAGIAPNPLIGSLGLPTDERGYILCEPDLRVRGFDDVWAIGDCAVNVGPDGRPEPATAQNAVRQAKSVAANIARVTVGREAKRHAYTALGSLAAIGCRTGVAKVFGLKLSGFWAWFLWRTVYLMKMPGFGRRVRVALDWSFELVFRREYVQLGIHRKDER